MPTSCSFIVPQVFTRFLRAHIDISLCMRACQCPVCRSSFLSSAFSRYFHALSFVELRPSALFFNVSKLNSCGALATLLFSLVVCLCDPVFHPVVVLVFSLAPSLTLYRSLHSSRSHARFLALYLFLSLFSLFLSFSFFLLSFYSFSPLSPAVHVGFLVSSLLFDPRLSWISDTTLSPPVSCFFLTYSVWLVSVLETHESWS